MAEYVLIWVFIAYSKTTSGSADFYTEQSCLDAKYTLEKTVINSGKFDSVIIECYKTN